MSGVLGGLLGSFPTPVSGAFESIATATGNGSSATLSFSSIPGTYSALQLRMNVWGDGNGTVGLKFNSDSASNYNFHHLWQTGSGISGAGFANRGYVELTTAQTVNYGTDSMFALVIDIEDYASTSKFKSFRTAFGKNNNGSGVVGVGSGAWRSTSAINSIQISLDTGSFQSPSMIALYGIKGAA